MAYMVTNDISMLTGGAEIGGIDATIVLQQVMAAGLEQMVAGRLASNYQFNGMGRVCNLPYTVGVDFSTATAEAVEISHQPQTIDKDVATIAKYTLDIPVSYEGENHSAASAVTAVKEDIGRAYSKKVDGLLWAAGNAATTSDIDCGTAVAMSHLVSAYKTLATLKAPQPYICLLHPEHWADLMGTIALTAPQPNTQWAGGPMGGMYVGRIAGLECFVDPNGTGTAQTHATTAWRSMVFAQRGLWWVWKPTSIPQAGQIGTVANGPIGLEVAWRYEFRSYVVSATLAGAAVVRRMGATDAPWLLNIHDWTP